jgi:hypothetical protein
MWVLTHAAALAAAIGAIWLAIKAVTKLTSTTKDDEVVDKLEPYVEKGVEALEKVADAKDTKPQ